MYTATGKTIDGFYEMLLGGSQFDPQDGDNTLFASLKRQAMETFNNISLPTLQQGLALRFHPAYTSPKNWYDASVEGNWATFSSNSPAQPPPLMARVTDPSQPPPPSPMAPVRPDFANHPWTWHVLPRDVQPVSPNSSPLGQIVMAVSTRDLTSDMGSASPSGEPPTERPPSYGTMLRVVAGKQSLPSDALPADHVEVKPTTLFATANSTLVMGTSASPLIRDHRTSASPLIRDHRTINTGVATMPTTPNQTVEPQILTLEFQYCLVKIDRPWLSQPFLFTHDWYMPGFKAGEFSSGAALSKEGIFPALPIACIIVKDLKITANAAEISVVAGQAMAFGPFVLFGQTINETKTTLTVEGMQAIAWIIQLLPVLPPLGSPMLLNAPLGLSSQPGVAEPIFTVLPQGTSVMPTSEEVTIGDTVLIKVKAGNQTGWVNKHFLG
jgi:hypothetical protein